MRSIKNKVEYDTHEEILYGVKRANVAQYICKDLAIFALPVLVKCNKTRTETDPKTDETLTEKPLQPEYYTASQLIISHRTESEKPTLRSLQFSQHKLIEEYKIFADQPLLEGFESRFDFTLIKKLVDEHVAPDVKVHELYAKIMAQLRQYFEYANEEDYIISALYPIGTYFYRMFNAYPYLFFNGAMETAKTKSARLQNQLNFNSILSSNMTTSSLFRLVDGACASIIIDETEGLYDAERQKDLRAILNAGYQKSDSKVYRTEGDKQKRVKPFDAYSPKIIANINGLDSVIYSRCIPIGTIRSINQAIINSEIDAEDETWQSIRNDLYVLAFTRWMELWEIKQTTDNTYGISGREWELWKPLVCIAKWIDNYSDKPFLEQKLVEYMPQVTKRKREEQARNDKHYKLIAFLASYCKEDKEYSTGDLNVQFNLYYGYNLTDSPFPNEDSYGRAMSLLHFKTGEDTHKRGWKLELDHLKHLCKTYGIDYDRMRSGNNGTR